MMLREEVVDEDVFSWICWARWEMKYWGFPDTFSTLPAPDVDLPGDEKGNQLLGDLPEIHVAAHEKVFMASIGVPQRIGIVLENVDFSRQSFFAQSFFRRRQTGFQQPLAGFVMNDEIQNVVAFGSRIFGMAAGVLIKSRAIDQKCIGRPAVGNQSFEDVPKHLFHRQINPAVGRKNQSVLVLETEDSLFHGDRVQQGADYSSLRLY